MNNDAAYCAVFTVAELKVLAYDFKAVDCEVDAEIFREAVAVTYLCKLGSNTIRFELIDFRLPA